MQADIRIGPEARGRLIKRRIVNRKKTSAGLIDTILHQKGKDVICLYLREWDSGQPHANVKLRPLKKYGRQWSNSIVIVAREQDSPGPCAMLHLMPLTHTRWQKYFMEKGA